MCILKIRPSVLVSFYLFVGINHYQYLLQRDLSMFSSLSTFVLSFIPFFIGILSLIVAASYFPLFQRKASRVPFTFHSTRQIAKAILVTIFLFGFSALAYPVEPTFFKQSACEQDYLNNKVEKGGTVRYISIYQARFSCR